MTDAWARGPLTGVRIIDFTLVVSGPMATMILADQGADVVKVEPPGVGDIVRYLGASRNGVSALFANNNRGKRSIVLDLSTNRGREVALALTDGADVVVQNFRPGAADRAGIGYDTVSSRNPDVVYLSISGFGSDGPRASKRVYDNVIQGYSGAAASQTGIDGEPTVIKQLFCDKVTALTASQAVCAALLARANGAGGQHLHVSMLDAAVAFLWPDTMMSDTLLGDDVQPSVTIGSLYGTTPSADGYITATAVSDVEFQALCRAVDAPGIAGDPRFANVASRMANGVAMVDAIASACRRFTTAELIDRLERNDVPCAPIQTMHDLVNDPQASHNELISERQDPVMGQLRQPRPAPRFGLTPAHGEGAVPSLGEHHAEVLAELGYDEAAVAELRAGGALG